MLKRWKEVLPVGIILLFSLFLFRNYFLKGLVPFPANLLVSYYEPWRSYPVPEYHNGPPNKAMGFDNVRVYYPLKKVALDAIRNFQPPLWNPYSASGTVLLGTYQAAVFHPLASLFLWLPMIDAWSILIMLQPILAAFSMYLFLGVLAVSPAARLIGTLSYSFSGFFMVWWQEAYMYTYSSLCMPIALFAAEMYLRKPKYRWLILFAISLAICVYSGMPQITVYVFAFTALWLLYRVWRLENRLQYVLRFLFAYGLSFLLSAVILLPGAEAYIYSTRVSADAKYIFDSFLLPVTRLITLIAPDYFGNPATYNYFGNGFYHDRLIWLGTVPFILLLTQLFQKKSPYLHAKFFRITFLVSLSLMLSLPTTWFILYYLKLPLLSTMTPTRMMMIVTFAGAVLAAYGAEAYREGFPVKVLVLITRMLGIVLVVALIIPVVLTNMHIYKLAWQYTAMRNLVLPTASVLMTLGVLWITRSKQQLRSAGIVALLFILLSNAYLFSNKYLYFSERRFVFPDTAVLDELKIRSRFDRFWTYENGYMEKNFASYYGLFSPEGYDAYMIKRYGEFLAFTNSHGSSMSPDRSNTLIQSTDHLSDVLNDPYRKRTLELLGVRYILRKLTPDRNEETLLPDPIALPRVWQDGTYAIHEFAAALPRASIYSDVVVIPDGKELLQRLYDEKTDIRRTIFLETQPEDFIVAPGATGSANIIAYTPNTVTVRSDTNGNAMLLLSDVFYPGWKAYIDGKQSKVLRADYAIRAVAIPDGNHDVVFRYEPMTWYFGVGGSLTGVVLCGVLWFTDNRMRKIPRLDRKGLS